MGNPAILSTVHLLPNERAGQWHRREREYSPKLPNRGNLAIAVAPPAVECHVLHLESDREGQ